MFVLPDESAVSAAWDHNKNVYGGSARPLPNADTYIIIGSRSNPWRGPPGVQGCFPFLNFLPGRLLTSSDASICTNHFTGLSRDFSHSSIFYTRRNLPVWTPYHITTRGQSCCAFTLPTQTLTVVTRVGFDPCQAYWFMLIDSHCSNHRTYGSQAPLVTSPPNLPVLCTWQTTPMSHLLSVKICSRVNVWSKAVLRLVWFNLIYSCVIIIITVH